MWSLPEDEEDENTMKKRTFLAKVMTLYAKYVRFACVARAFCVRCTCVLHALHLHFAYSVLARVVRTLYMRFCAFLSGENASLDPLFSGVRFKVFRKEAEVPMNINCS